MTLRQLARILLNVVQNGLESLRRPVGYTPQERALFGEVLNVWRPISGSNGVMLRWLLTEWCNYRCSYCFQGSHERSASIDNRFTAHAFDNFPVERWLAAFDRHFSGKRLCLTITGGEPMLDVANMRKLLARLDEAFWCDAIRIDTNASWNPKVYEGTSAAKVMLNCSYHPTMVSEDKFVAKLAALKESGFKVGMVNFVLSGEQKVDFYRLREKLNALGIPINANPELQERYRYDDELLDRLRECILQDDFYFKIGKSPHGKPCLYPSLAYEMSPSGYLSVGCIGKRHGSIFDPVLPSIGSRSVPCPHNECSCIDKYSFLSQFKRNLSTNVFKTYCDLLRENGNSR